MLMVHSVALAQSVEVVGYGDDKGAAKKDAMRAAVEQVVGTFLDSKTLISQSVVVRDEIYSKAQGFVTNINVLEEGKSGDNYFVRARVGVNTNPDSQLQDRLQMIMLLGDPRIGVVAFKNSTNTYEYGNNPYDDITEQAVNAKLLSLGFTHVADVSLTSKLRNSTLLNSVYNGDNNLPDGNSLYGIDILVLVKSSVDSTKIALMKQDGTNVETQLVRGTANVTGKVIEFTTGIIRGTFDVKGQAVDISDVTAQNKALQDVSSNIAQEVERILRGEASRVFNGVQIIISTDDHGKVEELTNDLKGISGVQNVYMREHQDGKGIIEVETTLKPHIILKRLREKSRLGLFNEGVSDRSMRLIVK